MATKQQGYEKKLSDAERCTDMRVGNTGESGCGKSMVASTVEIKPRIHGKDPTLRRKGN